MISLSAVRELITDTMGMCLSCCFPDNSDGDSVGPDGDRSRLINGEVVPVTEGIYGRDSDEEVHEDIAYGSFGDPNRSSGIHFSASLTKTKDNDDQSALAEIIHHMADNIIDVNMAHTSQTLEPAELQERAFEYGRQLQLVAPKLANKYSYLKSGKSEGLQDIGTSVNKVDSLVQSEVLNTADKLLISEVAARAREANAEFKIDPVPGLTGVFGQIRKTRQIDGGNFGNGSGSDEEDGSIIDEDEILEQQNNQKNLDDASIEDEEEESS